MHLLGVLANFKKLVKLAPHHLQYPDPKAADARRPKRVEILPDNQQIIETGGLYMFTVKTNTFKRGLFLGLGIVLGMLVLLWRVWPTWLRIGVWYVSYYLAVTLVSFLDKLKNFCLDRYRNPPPDNLVLPIPLWHRLLAFSQLFYWLKQSTGLVCSIPRSDQTRRHPRPQNVHPEISQCDCHRFLCAWNHAKWKNYGRCT